MRFQWAKSFRILFILFAFGLPGLSACGVLEVGIEITPTTPALIMITPVSTLPLPTATQTPFPGKLKAGQPVKVMQIHMLSKTDGWAVGQVETDLNDHILFTLDGGQSWQERTPPAALLNPPPAGLNAATFFGTDGNAWATFAGQIGQQTSEPQQKIWHTTDEGETWQAADIDMTGLQADYFVPSNLGFLDAQFGWMMAHLGAGMNHDYFAIFTSKDGGVTWQRLIDPQNNSDMMGCAKTGLAFSTITNGWLTGNCPGLMQKLFFYNTVDGGKTWQQISFSPPANQPEELFSNENAACGIPDLIFTSARSMLVNTRCTFYNTNKTISWLYAGKDNRIPEARYVPTPFGSFNFINADEGWMIGTWRDDQSAPGEIYHTTDGGQTWKLVISTAWQGVPDFIDSNNGWVVARSADRIALVFSSDSGLTWTELTPRVAR